MKSFDYSQLARKTWETDILNLVARIHEHKGRQDLFVRQKPVELERLVKIAKIQSTEASNKIEGIVTTSTRMKQLFEEKTTPRNRDEDEILGYRDVLNTIHPLHLTVIDEKKRVNDTWDCSDKEMKYYWYRAIK